MNLIDRKVIVNNLRAPHYKMRSIMLILFLGCLVHQIASNIVFEDKTLYEGDNCVLSNGRPGQCRKASACTTVGGGELKLCRSDGSRMVGCCDVVQQQCNAVFNATATRISDHIVGVVDRAESGEFPFIALVIYNTTVHRCGATIISERFLLSAAHCFRSEFTALKVRVGTTEAEDGMADTYEIARVRRHSRYGSLRRLNDIAVIELKTKIKMNQQVQPICLYTEKEELPETQNLTVIGWGIDNSEDVSRVLLKGIVRPVLRSNCHQRFNKDFVRFNVTDGHLCALGEQNEDGTATDACQGDSGGPLVLRQNDKYYLVGVVSSGPACGGTELAGIYTWVSKYLEWIIEQQAWRNSPR
ncbi:CLIP domain-containing serine protease C9-like [Armigeres subalbatus]|uniref:CLIP domain-containing serine protease C9-like n=1 Tax=Armigeres subalbatus TaxID=124917 RepID=UPI002ED289A2